jgi:hypothetical protein
MVESKVGGVEIAPEWGQSKPYKSRVGERPRCSHAKLECSIRKVHATGLHDST